ncbi:MAG: methionyl-tRNA formyltransferase, partial [Acidobacteria bacterium]|nr:methionyl-tRNA formyltransferase [Acidobacteriota bacterium]
EDGRIDWNLPATAIHNRIRGLQPWPGAFTRFRGATLILWRSRLAPPQPGAPGQLRRAGGSLFVSSGSRTALELLEVQLEGRKKMPAADFANGQRLAENEVFV